MEHQNQALLLAILNTAVDGIIVINGSGIIQTVNPGTTRLFGYEKDELIGQNVKILMPDPYREEHDRYLENYHRSGQAKIIGIGREVIGKRKDESTFPMHLAVSELTVGDKTLFAGIVRDISDLKDAQDLLAQANEQLEQRVKERTEELHAAQAELLKSERMATLGQVSGGIAHEIRNPLNAVRTSVYYLRHVKSPSAAKVEEHLERIDRQVSLIDNVVTALSDIARMPEPVVSVCNINDILREIVATVSMPSRIDVKMDLPPEPLYALGDPNQISIVFRNLVRNARDAMPDGGCIRITTERQDDELIVHVIDAGIGIAKEDLQRITEPLYSTKARGMGLGLAISTAILKKNSGRLSVHSELGKGATFSVHLKKANAGDPNA